MGKNKQKKEVPKSNKTFLFGKRNYQILSIAILIIAIGFILMAGGGSDDPKVFNDAIYNFRRIRLAPTLVLIGFAVTIYAILYQEKPAK